MPSTATGLFYDIPVAQPSATPVVSSAVGLFDDIPIATKRAQGGQPAQQQQFDEWGNVTDPGDSKAALDTATDLGRSVLSGADRGVAQLAGLPADAAILLSHLVDKAQAHFTGRPEEQIRAEKDASGVFPLSALEAWGSQAAHANSPLKYDPQTEAGKMAENVASFVPGAMLGPGNLARNLVAFGAVPAIADEAVRHVTDNPTIRAGVDIAAGGVGALATRAGAAGNLVTKAAEGLTPAQMDAAEQLFQDAQKAGLPLTRAEAVQKVTNNGTNLGDLQRQAEGYGALKPFMAERPQQVKDLVRDTADTLAPVPDRPSSIGPDVQKAANGVLGDAQADVNATTRPLYDEATSARVGPAVSQSLEGDPRYAATLKEIRNDPVLNHTIADKPDDSVAVLDLVQRRLAEKADAARVPGQASTSNLAAANLEDARTAPMAAANTVTGSRAATETAPAQVGSYEAARAQQAALREQYLDPLKEGPIGEIIESDPDTQAVANALFPINPNAHSAGEITNAVQKLANKNPDAARQLVRAHVESVFNEAITKLQTGDNQFGGASFAVALRGNPQQAENLNAAITALHGPEVAQGFDRALQIMEATGNRMRVGSNTTFNTEFREHLKQGPLVGSAVPVIASGGLKLPTRLEKAYEKWNLGRNVDTIAHLLTDPNGAEAFRKLALAPSSGRQASMAAGRIAYLGLENAERPKDTPAPSERVLSVPVPLQRHPEHDDRTIDGRFATPVGK